MNRKIVFSKKAELQIEEIYQYVLSKSNDEGTAKKFVNELIDKTEILKTQAFWDDEKYIFKKIQKK